MTEQMKLLTLANKFIEFNFHENPSVETLEEYIKFIRRSMRDKVILRDAVGFMQERSMSAIYQRN